MCDSRTSQKSTGLRDLASRWLSWPQSLPKAQIHFNFLDTLDLLGWQYLSCSSAEWTGIIESHSIGGMKLTIILSVSCVFAKGRLHMSKPIVLTRIRNALIFKMLGIHMSVDLQNDNLSFDYGS